MDVQSLDEKSLEKIAELFAERGFGSEMVDQAVSAEEAKINSYLNEDNKIKKELVFKIAPGNAVKSLKKRSDS